MAGTSVPHENRTAKKNANAHATVKPMNVAVMMENRFRTPVQKIRR